MYLLDTNVISEYRKGPQANAGIVAFFDKTPNDVLFLPAQVIGEIQAGISKLRRQRSAPAEKKADAYELWLDHLVTEYGDHVLEFDTGAARVWGALLSSEKRDPHATDKQIAALALVHSLVVVTRDAGEAFKKSPNLRVLNPFLNS